MARILVAMSGGVDSAVSAHLLKSQGHEVVGANMRFWEYKNPLPSSQSSEATAKLSNGKCATSSVKKVTSCCSPEDLAEAESTARGIGIPFYSLKMESDFREKVIDPFISDYANGLTPNPCVHCNTFVKFGDFYSRASALGFDQIATGHYADVQQLPNGRWAVFPAADARKDQSYYLYGLSQSALARTIFPLAKFTKDAVRVIAEENRIQVARKPDSQEICFIPDNDHKNFLESQGVDRRPGYFRDRLGGILGRHDGAVGLTIGQRKGLGGSIGNLQLGDAFDSNSSSMDASGSRSTRGTSKREPQSMDASGSRSTRGTSKREPQSMDASGSRSTRGTSKREPKFVIDILPNGDVIIGDRVDLERTEFFIRDAVFQGMAEDDVSWQSGVKCLAQIRYNSKPVSGIARREGDLLRITLDTSAWAITPGQAGVLYDPDQHYILAGGKIKLTT